MHRTSLLVAIVITIGACEPSPVEERHAQVCRRFWQFGVAALAIQVLSVLFVGQAL